MYDPEDDDYTVEDAAEDTGVSVEEAEAAWEYAEEGQHNHKANGESLVLVAKTRLSPVV